MRENENRLIRRHARQASVVLFGLLLLGTVGYHVIEGWPLFDGLYMTVISLSTIGYGETNPLSHEGRVFTLLLIFIGVGNLAYVLAGTTQFFAAGGLVAYRRRARMERNLETISGHTIICGCGRLGLAIVHELEAKNAPFVAIERDPELIETLRAANPRLLLVQGDAGEDDVLIAAGVKRARALVAALNDDASNVFLTLTARVLNAKVVIHGKADDPDTLRKLERAGANHPFSPSLVAGQRIAEQLTRPTVAELVGVVTSITDQELSIEEVPASAVRGLVGRPLSESPLWGQPRTLVLAVKKADGRLLFPALADYVVVSHDYLVLMGEPARLRLLVDPSGT